MTPNMPNRWPYELITTLTGCGDDVQSAEVQARLLEVHGARNWQAGHHPFSSFFITSIMIFIVNHCHFHPSIELVRYRHWWKIWCWWWWRSFKVGICWWWLLLEIHGTYCRQDNALMITLFNFFSAFLSLSQSSQVHVVVIALFNFPSFWLSFQFHFLHLQANKWDWGDFLHLSMSWWLQISNFPSFGFHFTFFRDDYLLFSLTLLHLHSHFHPSLSYSLNKLSK